MPDQVSDKEAGMVPEPVDMARRVAPVRTASGVANVHAQVRRTDLATQGFGTTTPAATPDLLTVPGGSVHSGTFLSQATEKFPAVVLGSKSATWLGIASVSGAPQIRLGDKWFAVTGCSARCRCARGRAVRAGRLGRARTRLAFDGRPTVVCVRSDEAAIDDVRQVLPGTLNPGQPGLVQVSRLSDALAAKRITHDAFGTLLLGLAGVALLVGGIGVANTMVISVLERGREIGLRRAIGASRGQIRGQFLTESVVLCGLGGIAGGTLGIAGTAAYAHLRCWPLVVPGTAVLGGLTASVAIGGVPGDQGVRADANRRTRVTLTSALGSQSGSARDAAGEADAGQGRARSAAHAGTELRAEVGRVPVRGVPGRRRDRAGFAQRPAVDPVLPGTGRAAAGGLAAAVRGGR
ncbi:putative ABC transport system permease protein [Kibdelosporangium phytohabitans]|nr:putative ABC transport system permease protein [Kibdelosporangium phytohabitans]